MAAAPMAPIMSQTTPEDFYVDRFAGEASFQEAWPEGVEKLATLSDDVASHMESITGAVSEQREGIEEVFARLKSATESVRAMGEDVPLADLATRFRLNSFELKCVVLALASHIEPRMASPT